MGGVAVTLLGTIADHWGVPMALKTIMALPLLAFGLSLLVRYPPKEQMERAKGDAETGR